MLKTYIIHLYSMVLNFARNTQIHNLKVDKLRPLDLLKPSIDISCVVLTSHGSILAPLVILVLVLYIEG